MWKFWGRHNEDEQFWAAYDWDLNDWVVIQRVPREQLNTLELEYGPATEEQCYNYVRDRRTGRRNSDDASES